MPPFLQHRRVGRLPSRGLPGFAPSSLAAPEPNALVWENQDAFRINKKAAQATKRPFPEAASALARPRGVSPRHRSLNASWGFHWIASPEQRPQGFVQPGFDEAASASLPVASNVEVQGNDTPMNTNIRYPIFKDAPRALVQPPFDWTTCRARNPVVSCHPSFTPRANRARRQTFVVFSGVASALHFYVNGSHFCFSQDAALH